VEYSEHVKNARMKATMDALSGGRLEIGTVGMSSVLVSMSLGRGHISGSQVVWAVEEAIATGEGTARAARIRTANGIAVTGFTVGERGSKSTIELGTTRILPGTVVMLSEFAIEHN
jgi:hypothetical protein